MRLFAAFLIVFAATVAVEGLLAFALFRERRLVYYTFLCNLLTNPALNGLLTLAVRSFGLGVYTPVLVVLEIAVVLVEAFVLNYLTGRGRGASLVLSLMLNAASFAVGRIIL